MSSATLRAGERVEFAPLRNFDVEDTGIIHDDEIGDDDGAPTQASERQLLFRAFCWTLCSATAIYTTKRLMTIHGYHYPLTIAFRSFASIFLTYVILLRLGSDYSNKIGGRFSLWGLKTPGRWDFQASKNWTVVVPAALSAAVSLPMLLEGLLHMPSLPVLVMLFPMVYAAESLALLLFCSPSRSHSWVPSEAVAVTVASSVVLYAEYRLMVPGLVWGVTGILFMGFSRALFVLGSERCGPQIAVQARQKAYHGFAIMTLLFGLLISGFMSYILEHNGPVRSLTPDTTAITVLNIASIISTAFSGTSVLAYSPISFEDTKPCFSSIPTSGLEVLASSASSLVILLLAISSGPVTVVSWIQIIAYLVAAVCLLGADRIHGYILIANENVQQHINKSFRISLENRKPSKVFTGGALVIVLLFVSGTIFTFSSASLTSITPGLPANLDLNYTTSSRFDIVVSMYNEDPELVRFTLATIKSTSYLGTLTPRVTVYTKDSKADLESLKKATGADVVEPLENLGREGGTYLHHIVNKWDNLAEQTMFLQAHAHNMRELTPRINDYLVPQTGMLTLGFTGQLCDCKTCDDRWGWQDQWNIIPKTYEQIYSAPCKDDTPILLSYKGQFVASARRIRGIDKKVYVELLEAITSKEGWSHDPKVVGGSVDTPDNPYFGFTVERIWSLLLQCATDGGVAARCPSLLSGMGWRGKVSDCQCLDEQ